MIDCPSNLLESGTNLSASNVEFVISGQKRFPMDLAIGSLPSSTRLARYCVSRPRTEVASDIRRPESQSRNDFSVRAPDVLGHEIKNPLAAIRGAAQLLARSVEEEGIAPTQK